MNETELENLIVRLTGNSDGLKGMYVQAENLTINFGKTVEETGKKIDGLADTVRNMATAAATALGALGVRHWLDEGIAAWASQEDAILKTEAVMRANGTYTQALARDYEEFSSAIQEVTRHADENTLAVIAQAESFGLTGEAAKTATKNAIAFAEINGGSAQAYLRFTAAMQRGDTEMMKRMARMIPQLRGIKDESELVAKAQRLVAAGWELAQKRAQTFTGQIEQLKNAYGDFMEDVGRITGTVIQPLVTRIKDVVAWFQSWDESNKRILVYLAIAAAGVLSVVSAIATLKAIGGPIIAFIASGFSTVAAAVGAIGGGPLLAIAAVLAVLGTATYKWVQSVGGVGNAWTIVKDKALQAWDWIQNRANDLWQFLRPFFDWLGSVWDEYSGSALTAVTYVWDTVRGFIAWARPVILAWFGYWKAGWGAIIDVVKYVWELHVTIFNAIDEIVRSTFGGWGELFRGVFSVLTMGLFDFGGDIQSTLVDAFIAAEFILRNFGMVWSLVWATAKYKAVEVFNTVSFFFTDQLLPLLNYFRTNWVSVFAAVGRAGLAVFNELSFANLERLIRGQTSFAAIGARISSAVSSAMSNLPPINLPVRVPTALENQLRQEFEQLAAGVGQSWAQFRERRLREIAATDPQRLRETRENGRHLGDAMGDGMVRGLLKQLEKFDAALVGSAEHATRLFSYILMRTGRLGGEGHPSEIGGQAGNDVTGLFNLARSGASGAGGFAGGTAGSTPPSIPGAAASQGPADLRPVLQAGFQAMINLLTAINNRQLQQAGQPQQQAVQLNFVPAGLS